MTDEQIDRQGDRGANVISFSERASKKAGATSACISVHQLADGRWAVDHCSRHFDSIALIKTFDDRETALYFANGVAAVRRLPLEVSHDGGAA